MKKNNKNGDHEISYKYNFKFSDNEEKEFTVTIDKENLELILTKIKNPPDWALLNFNRCPICLLNENEHKYCPAAISVIDLLEFFRDTASTGKVEVTLETRERKYSHHTTIQRGLSSIFGVCMATSGCPVIGKLKPMARFHLPFATSEETTCRAMSMYLLGQYFSQFRNKKPDWKLKNLEKIYKDIHEVNQHFARRLQDFSKKDANINALIILDTFAHFVLFELDHRMLNELENIFQVYF